MGFCLLEFVGVLNIGLGGGNGVDGKILFFSGGYYWSVKWVYLLILVFNLWIFVLLFLFVFWFIEIGFKKIDDFWWGLFKFVVICLESWILKCINCNINVWKF